MGLSGVQWHSASTCGEGRCAGRALLLAGECLRPTVWRNRRTFCVGGKTGISRTHAPFPLRRETFCVFAALAVFLRTNGLRADPAAPNDNFLRDYAETRGFMLGRPVNATLPRTARPSFFCAPNPAANPARSFTPSMWPAARRVDSFHPRTRSRARAKNFPPRKNPAANASASASVGSRRSAFPGTARSCC